MIRTLSFFALFSGPVWAFEVAVPGDLILRDASPLDVHTLATGPSVAGDIPTTRHEGPMTRLVWQIDEIESTLATLAPIRDQLEAEGFEITFACATQSCGGFDFRFGIDVTPAPKMFVDLSDFHYLAAHRDDGVASLVVSKSGKRGYVQLTVLGGPNPDQGPAGVVKSTRIGPLSLTDFSAELLSQGVAILNGVDFETGRAALTTGRVPSLEALADFLAENNARKVALVGHTDAEGGYEGNLSLSLQRAEAVLDFLVSELGVNPTQLEAKGIGYLAPRASNLTDDGRSQNRRVEAVLVTAE